MTTNLNSGGYTITNLAIPIGSSDAATKSYVDSHSTPSTQSLNQISTTNYNTGNIDMNNYECVNSAVVPTSSLSLTSKAYVDQ